MNPTIQDKLALLPDSPGCYLMKENGQIIYVGKAKSLRSRVQSYFRTQDHTPKVAALVSRIDDFDVMLCQSNMEALILENNLIKLHQPYYNILLKDDKRYPYVRIDLNDPFPKITIARRLADDGAKYFGPFIGANAIRQVMRLLTGAFPLRNCSLKFPLPKPVRPCINYDIGRCLGPCANHCTKEEYDEMVGHVLSFLKGNYKPVLDQVKQDMEKASRNLQFERAAELRDSIRDIMNLMQQQTAQQQNKAEQDIIALAQDGLDAMAQVLFVRQGKLIGQDSYALPREGMEPPDEVLAAFATRYYDGRVPPRELVLEAADDPESLEGWLKDRREGSFTLTIPQRGDKRQLVLTAQRNAQNELRKRNAQQAIRIERTVGAAKELAEALGLEKLPQRIEGFDISNTQGAQSVASMVVFIEGAPEKKEYRHFRIKTVEGANDFASMAEVISRRFLRATTGEEQARWPLPDLVLVDGGPEQLIYARQAMLEAGADVPIFALAERLEEIYLPDQKHPILLPQRSAALHLIQRIRDESHRFAITHHRKLRGKASFRSRLEEVPGIGPARRRALLAHFRTMGRIQEASQEALAAVRGMTKDSAAALYQALHPDRNLPADG